MVTHMKTTVELAPDLFDRVKRRAKAEGVTFKAIVESALWQMLKAVPSKRQRGEMPDRSVDGEGYQDGIDPTNWNQIRSLMYEDNRG